LGLAEATAVSVRGEGLVHAEITPGWRGGGGPHGGYVAALVLRALQTVLGDPARPARSLTLHYLRPPADGPVTVEAQVERAGRSLSQLSGRLVQSGQTCALALAAFSAARDAPASVTPERPAAPPAELLTSLDVAGAGGRRSGPASSTTASSRRTALCGPPTAVCSPTRASSRSCGSRRTAGRGVRPG
jgi:acyl-coenzyme A thioesterase PaaI-like protein